MAAIPNLCTARDQLRLASVFGFVQCFAGDIASAESSLVLGLERARTMGLARTPEYGMALERLGGTQLYAMRRSEALRLHERAVALLDSLVGRRDERCLRARGRWAAELVITGRPLESLAAVTEDFDTLAAMGMEHSDISIYTRWQQALALWNLGDWEGVLVAYRKNHAIAAASCGPDSPIALVTQCEVATALLGLKRYREALHAYDDVLLKQDPGSTPGPDFTTVTQLNRALALLALGRIGEAGIAVAIADSATRYFHGDHASRSLDVDEMRVALAWARGDASQVAAAESTLGEERSARHPSNVERLKLSLGTLEYLAWCGSSAAVVDSAVTMAAAFRSIFETLAPHLDPQELRRFIPDKPPPLDLLLSLALDRRPDRTRWLPDLYREALRHRSLIREMYARRASLAGDPDSIVAIRAEIARRVLGATQGAGEPAEITRVDSLRGVLREYANRGARPPAADSSEPDAPQLPPGSALVSYFRFERSDRTRGPATAPRPRRSEYLAFVRRSGTDLPAVVSLGPAAPIDSLAVRWSEILRARGDARTADTLGAALRRRVWDPLQSAVGRSRMVLLVPDGPLLRVNFAALRGRDGRYLVEQALLLHVLSDERDLLAHGADPPGSGTLAVGDVDYASAQLPAVPRSHAVRTARDRAARPSCSEFMDYVFAPLPASGWEVRSIARIMRRSKPDTCDLVEGSLASEARVRRELPGRRWAHLATHAFFLAEDCAGSAATEEWVRRNPLVFSGIALAGANHHAQAPAATDDGLLTAEEICGLNLRGLDWLVLSGCETGLGMSESWENVDGLRRAVREAGVHTTITSLWPVDDDVSAFWMEQLYTARFTRHEETALAVRSASRATLAMLRRAGRPADPRLWAAFLAVGDWR